MSEIERAYSAFAAGRHAEAAGLVQRVLGRAPGDPAALTLAGRLAVASGEADVAHELLSRVIAAYPQVSAVWLDLAMALRDLGRHEDAANAAARATALDGGNAQAWVCAGEVQLSLGAQAEAAEAFRRALKVAPGSVPAWRGLCLAETVQPGSETAARLAELAESSACGTAQKAGLHYSLAQLHRSAGDRAGFLRHLMTANRLQRSLSPHGRAEYAAEFDRLESILTREALERLGSAAPVEPRPVFILGMPRSGTTLVERLLAGHPGVAAGGELELIRRPLARRIEKLTGRPFPESIETIAPPDRDQLAAEFARRLRLIGPEAGQVTDKTPGNYHLLGLLVALFPGGSILHLRRDPMDTCFSILQYPFGEQSPHTCDMELLAYVYARYQRLMDSWGEWLGGQFLDVSYEELVTDPTAQAQRFFAYCGLDWDDACLDLQLPGGAVRTFSKAQVRRPIYTSSVGAWREYEEALLPLRRALEAELGHKLA